MANYVVEKKSKEYLISAITTTVLCLIPIGIIALISIGNPNVWSAPYPKFVLYFLIIHTIFAFGVGYIGQIFKIAYIIFESIAVVGTVVLIILGYVLGNPIIMHLGAASLFVLMMYLFSNSGGDNYFFRYSIPVMIDIAGLITVLWFVGIGMSLTAHIVIVSILNVIFGLISFFRLKDDIKYGFSFIKEKMVSYTEETKQERLQAKRERQKKKAETRQEKAEKKQKTKHEMTQEEREEWERTKAMILQREKEKSEKILYKKSGRYKYDKQKKREAWLKKTFPGYYKVKDFINNTQIAILDAELKAYDVFDKGMTLIFGSNWVEGVRDVPKAASAHDAAVAFEDAITRNPKLPPYEYYANCYASSGHVACELKITYLGGHSYSEASEEITSYIMQNHSGALGGYDVEFMFK